MWFNSCMSNATTQDTSPYDPATIERTISREARENGPLYAKNGEVYVFTTPGGRVSHVVADIYESATSPRYVGLGGKSRHPKDYLRLWNCEGTAYFSAEVFGSGWYGPEDIQWLGNKEMGDSPPLCKRCAKKIEWMEGTQ